MMLASTGCSYMPLLSPLRIAIRSSPFSEISPPVVGGLGRAYCDFSPFGWRECVCVCVCKRGEWGISNLDIIMSVVWMKVCWKLQPFFCGQSKHER